MTARLSSLTVVSVVSGVVPVSVLEGLASALDTMVTDFDVVLVANAVDTDLARSLKTLVDAVPDVTVVFLAENVHDDLARLVGVEHAVGDHVLFYDLALDHLRDLPALLAPLHDGYDLVVGDAPDTGGVGRPGLPGLLLEGYLRTYHMMTGFELERRPTGLRVLSRAAALFLAARPNAELLVRARGIGNGFPATAVPVSAAPRVAPRASGAQHSWPQAISMLLSVSSMPLRGASYVSLLGGGLSVLYGFYVLGVFLFKPDVAAGWVTVSLQLTGMMFLFSLVFLFLSEYVIQIHAANPPRSRRYLVLRELRSPLSRRSARLNVVNEEGQFQLGAPPHLLAVAPERAP